MFYKSEWLITYCNVYKLAINHVICCVYVFFSFCFTNVLKVLKQGETCGIWGKKLWDLGSLRILPRKYKSEKS